MKWKAAIFWCVICTGLFTFLRSFSVYLYHQQEEMQLFVSEWSFIQNTLLQPGGFCNVLTQFFIQHYCHPWVSVGLNTFFIGITGILCYILLQRIVAQGYNLLLSLFPLLVLFKAHLQINYTLEGTIGIFLLLTALTVFTALRTERSRLIYSILSTLILFFLTGQLAFIYSVLLVVYSYFCRLKGWPYLGVAALTGFILMYAGIRMVWFMPLTAGLQPEEYHAAQLRPDSYIYYIWIRFSLLLFLVFTVTYLMKYIDWKGVMRKILITGIFAVILWLFAGFCMPAGYEVQNRTLYRFSFLSRQHDWKAIIHLCQGKQLPASIHRNYLNMALARQGLLGDRLFYFDQKGPQGLVAGWNRTYLMSVLLSDVHFYIGDISVSESYAMEGLTLSRKGESPRMLQRLAELNLIQGNRDLAEKYIRLLSKQPYYRTWAEQAVANKDLSPLKPIDAAASNLLCLFSVDSLWQMHLSGKAWNETAYQYLGCSYLLAKKLDEFKEFLVETTRIRGRQSLPVHFQEAVLMIAAEDPSVLDSVTIRTEVSEQFQHFRQQQRQVEAGKIQPAALYREYGRTFWFYYYYKQL